MKASQLLAWGERSIASSAAIDHWEKRGDRQDAERLLRYVLGHEPGPLEEVPPASARVFRRLVERRATGEPIPHITGYVSFLGLQIKVQSGVFVPRDSTEWLAEQAVRRLRRRLQPVAVDLGTGAGPVALAIAHRVPKARVLGTDISPSAIRLARRNADRLGLPVRFTVGDLLSGIPRSLAGTVDVITAHLPFIGKPELRWVPEEVVRFEPETALTDRSRDGLRLLQRLALEAPDWLRGRGWLLIEVASDRSRAVATMLRRAGYVDVRSTRGAMPWNRVVVARNRPGAGSRSRPSASV